MRFTLHFAVGLLAVVLCAPAMADEIEPPEVTLSCGTDDGLMVNWSPTFTPAGANQFVSSGTFTDTDGHWELTWDMTVDTDPFVSGVWGIRNLTNLWQNYTLIASTPVAPALPVSLMGGSTGGSTTDANFDGVGGVFTIAPAPLYTGLIDGVGVLPIYPDPNSWTYPMAGGTANIPAVNQGLPGPTIPGPAVLNSIGIQQRFMLSPNDIASFTSFFVVQIPEPATLGLLALGGLAMLRRRA